MARLRRDTLPTAVAPPLRIFATGAVFLTHSLAVPAHPHPGTASRAQFVNTSRGGSAAHVLALLAQLANTVPGEIEPMLIASLGGNADAVHLREALEAIGVRTKYCKIWPRLGVPSAWVIHARDIDTRTVINHNPLPEVSHEDFIALLGPVLAPENYHHISQSPLTPIPIPREQQSPSPIPIFPNTLAPPSSSAPRSSMSTRPSSSPTNNISPPSPHAYCVPSSSIHSPAPFDWLHLEGRSVRTTLANILGIDGLARERKWRSYCVVSVDLGRRARDGAYSLIPHADVVFLATTTFASLSNPSGQLGQPISIPSASASSPTSPNPTPSSRAILLSLARIAPPHALLVLNAGREGAALLSLPTSEYLQSSGWTPPPGHTHRSSSSSNGTRVHRQWDGVESVRSASDFWAGGGGGSGSGSGGGGGTANASFVSQDSPHLPPRRSDVRMHRPSGESFHPMDDDDEEEEEERLQEKMRVGGGNRDAVHGIRNGDTNGHGDGDGRTTPQPEHTHVTETEQRELDEEGAHAAFVAGMIWALSRRIMPGPPYAPGLQNGDAMSKDGTVGDLGLRWRLDECLRFATELAGRKAHVTADDIGVASVASSSGYTKDCGEWDGLGEAMRRAGWFD